MNADTSHFALRTSLFPFSARSIHDPTNKSCGPYILGLDLNLPDLAFDDRWRN